MGKRSRRHTGPQAAADVTTSAADRGGRRERSLLDAIASGELDEHLAALADAVGARMHLLHTVRHANALAQLCVGDEVRVNHTVKPRYLHGVCGRIIAIEGHNVTVSLQRPVGRFTSGQVRCSALALDRLSPAPTTQVA
jgi:hypothetical protein